MAVVSTVAAGPSQGTSGHSPGIPREVAECSLYFLQDELVKYIFESRFHSSIVIAEPSRSKEQGTTSVRSTTTHPSFTPHAQGIALLEEQGFNIGIRLVERCLTINIASVYYIIKFSYPPRL